MTSSTRDPSPVVRRRRLAAELARLRQADGRPSTEIAAVLGWSHTKVTRLHGETGTGLTFPKVDAIAGLYDEYARAAREREDGDAFTPERRRELLTLAVECRSLRGWWQDYPELPAGQATLIGLEAEAVVKRVFEPNIVPPLLQASAYSRALIAGRLPDLPADTVSRLIDVEERRRQLLHHPHPLQIRAVIAEPAIHWQIGGRKVLRDQLRHLQTLADLPNVDVRLLPFTAGAHPGFSAGGVLTFAEPLDPEIAYSRGPGGIVTTIEDVATVQAYGTALGALLLAALPPGASLARIRDAEKAL